MKLFDVFVVFLLFRVSFLHDVWCRFRAILVSFRCHFGSFCDHFGVILVPLGFIWRPGAPQGTPQGSQVKKVTKKLVRGSFVGSPLGALLESKSVTNRKKIVAKTLLCAKCYTRGLLGPPPTFKIVVSYSRNHFSHFHLYPEMTPNICSGYPFGNCLGCFGGHWATFGRLSIG